MSYSIGQVSQMFGLPVSTLRYYDNEGLFPNMKRVSGIRQFGEYEIAMLKVVECLKKSGLEIKDIKRFIDWCAQGSASYENRKNLFLKQKEKVESEIKKLNVTLDMLKFKCWYYERAQEDGNENRLKNLPSDDMPDDIRAAYENAMRD